MKQLVQDRMLDSADKFPAAEAIRINDRVVSYTALKQASLRIAATLSSTIIADEQCIGIYMAKCPEAIMAIYGVLHAGAVYVPLDIKNPAIRVQHIIDQCNLSTLITTPDLVENLRQILADAKQSFNILVVCDSDIETPLDQFRYLPVNINQSTNIDLPFSSTRNVNATHVDNLAVNIDSNAVNINSLATTLFTSGSTGMPKGAMISHNSINIFINWVNDYFQLTPKDRCISHAPFHFDLSLLDIFATHAAGACVVLVPDNMNGNPKFITQYLARHQVTVWQSVPSVLVLLLKYGDISKHKYPSLRHILFAGERVSGSLLENLSVHFENAAFHNIYGATETNDTFIFSIAAGIQTFPDPLPIGKALPYVEYLIVDNENNPVADFEEGELLVRTPTTMRGYKNTTTTGFIALSQPGDAGLTCDYYVTKDIVRMTADGNLLFCGRKDDIIKTSGNRVNLLEIENLLQTHPAISDVAVIPVPDDEAGNKIIAIFTLSPDSHASVIELKIFCANNLPKYAIPHIFEASSSPLPKTSSGKTNKQLLIKSRGNYVATA